MWSAIATVAVALINLILGRSKTPEPEPGQRELGRVRAASEAAAKVNPNVEDMANDPDNRARH